MGRGFSAVLACLVGIGMATSLISAGIVMRRGISREGRQQAGQAGRLTPVSAEGLRQLAPGSPALVVGAIGGALRPHHGGLVLCDVYEFRVAKRWARRWASAVKPAFQLLEGEEAITVLGGPYTLRQTRVVESPAGASSSDDGRRYQGFRTGDRVTVYGTVEVHGGRPVVRPASVFGGTPAEMYRYLGDTTKRLYLAGVVVLLSGAGVALAIGAALRRLRRIAHSRRLSGGRDLTPSLWEGRCPITAVPEAQTGDHSVPARTDTAGRHSAEAGSIG